MVFSWFVQKSSQPLITSNFSSAACGVLVLLYTKYQTSMYTSIVLKHALSFDCLRSQKSISMGSTPFTTEDSC